MSPQSRLLHPSAWPIAAKLSPVLLAVSLVPMVVTATLDVWQAREAAVGAERENLKMLAESTKMAHGLAERDYPGKSILVSREVAAALAEDPVGPRTDPLGPIKLKGRTEPVEVFAIVR